MSMPETTAEALLNSPDYFFCKKMLCRMPMATCLSNQKLAASSARVHFDTINGCDFTAINRKAFCLECGQGLEIKKEAEAMGERGTCDNCRRSNVLLVPGMKDKICWSCQKYAAGTSGDERIKKLAEAAEKYGEKKPGEGTPASPEKPPKAKNNIKNMGEDMSKVPNPHPEEVGAVKPPPPPPPPSALSKENRPYNDDLEVRAEKDENYVGYAHDVVSVDFGPDDLPLFEYLLDVCKRDRRTPDQQILHMLDCQFQADQEAGLAIPAEVLEAKMQLYT